MRKLRQKSMYVKNKHRNLGAVHLYKQELLQNWIIQIFM